MVKYLAYSASSLGVKFYGRLRTNAGLRKGYLFDTREWTRGEYKECYDLTWIIYIKILNKRFNINRWMGMFEFEWVINGDSFIRTGSSIWRRISAGL
jgi:hypothetical protein